MLTTKAEILPKGIERQCAAPANWARIVLREVSSNPDEHLTLFSEWEHTAYILHINNALIEYNPMYVRKCTLAELKKQYKGKPPKVCPYYQEIFSRDTTMSNIRITPLHNMPRDLMPDIQADKSPYIEPYTTRNIKIIDVDEFGEEYEPDDPNLMYDVDRFDLYTHSFSGIQKRMRNYTSNLVPPPPKQPSLFERISAGVKKFLRAI